jgi:hypothetical protein
MGAMRDVTVECHQGRAPAEGVAIRRRVFVGEQGVPEADELDGKDAERTHFLARNAAGRAVGCACLRPYGAQHKVERVAVLPELRAGQRGDVLREAWLGADRRALLRGGHRASEDGEADRLSAGYGQSSLRKPAQRRKSRPPSMVNVVPFT